MLPDHRFGLNRPPANCTLAAFPEQARIPRLLHQTYRSLDLPAELSGNIARLRADNPEWEYRFYDDADIERFILAEYGERVMSYYHRISPAYPAARADFFRYLLIYRHGGAYLDIKSSMSRPLREILREDDRYLLAHWPEDDPRFAGWGHYPELQAVGGREFQQWNIIAAAGHPFLYAVICQVMHNIDTYLPELHGVGSRAILRLTGPVAYTLSIYRMLDRGMHRVVGNHEAAGLIYSVYDSPISHRGTMSGHYTTVSEPLVLLHGRQKLISTAMRLGRRAARGLVRSLG